MKNSIAVAALAGSLLLLAGCGKSGNPDQAANSDTVEMPAEETVGPLPDDATPVADASAGADAAAATTPTPTATAKP